MGSLIPKRQQLCHSSNPTKEFCGRNNSSWQRLCSLRVTRLQCLEQYHRLNLAADNRARKRKFTLLPRKRRIGDLSNIHSGSCNRAGQQHTLAWDSHSYAFWQCADSRDRCDGNNGIAHSINRRSCFNHRHDLRVQSDDCLGFVFRASPCRALSTLDYARHVISRRRQYTAKHYEHCYRPSLCHLKLHCRNSYGESSFQL